MRRVGRAKPPQKNKKLSTDGSATPARHWSKRNTQPCPTHCEARPRAVLSLAGLACELALARTLASGSKLCQYRRRCASPTLRCCVLCDADWALQSGLRGLGVRAAVVHWTLMGTNAQHVLGQGGFMHDTARSSPLGARSFTKPAVVCLCGISNACFGIRMFQFHQGTTGGWTSWFLDLPSNGDSLSSATSLAFRP